MVRSRAAPAAMAPAPATSAAAAIPNATASPQRRADKLSSLFRRATDSGVLSALVALPLLSRARRRAPSCAVLSCNPLNNPKQTLESGSAATSRRRHLPAHRCQLRIHYSLEIVNNSQSLNQDALSFGRHRSPAPARARRERLPPCAGTGLAVPMAIRRMWYAFFCFQRSVEP